MDSDKKNYAPEYRWALRPPVPMCFGLEGRKPWLCDCCTVYFECSIVSEWDDQTLNERCQRGLLSVYIRENYELRKRIALLECSDNRSSVS